VGKNLPKSQVLGGDESDEDSDSEDDVDGEEEEEPAIADGGLESSQLEEGINLTIFALSLNLTFFFYKVII
jgi:hypothetical protein